MQQLTAVISRGWPSHVNNAPPDARPYFPFREELTLERGIILKGQKATFPSRFVQNTLNYCMKVTQVSKLPNAEPEI